MKEVIVYIAEDGSEFNSKAECIQYEKQLFVSAEKEAKLLELILVSRVTNLFEGGATVNNNEFSEDLFGSFDHCGFGDDFRTLLSIHNLDARFLTDHIDAFGRLAKLCKKIFASFKQDSEDNESLAHRKFIEDIALVPDLKMIEIVLHLDSFVSLASILINLQSEKEEIIALYRNQVAESEYYAELKCVDQEAGGRSNQIASGYVEDDSWQEAWQEELASRDPFEGSPN